MCGGGAWFESSLTVFEVIGMWVGYHEPSPMTGLDRLEQELGGVEPREAN